MNLLVLCITVTSQIDQNELCEVVMAGMKKDGLVLLKLFVCCLLTVWIS